MTSAAPRRLAAPVRLDREVLVEHAERYGVWILLALLAAYGLLAVPAFGTANNLSTVLGQGAVLGVVALGQTFVILAGGIDLSVGMLMGLVTVIGNGTMNGDPSLIAPVVLLAIAMGLAVGLANGLLVLVTRVQPLIVTLGTLSILQGVIFVYTDRTVGSAPAAFRTLAYGYVGPIPLPFLILVGLTLLSWGVLRQTPLGRYLYAVGSDERNARRAGVPIDRVKLAAYAISGLSAGLAGLVLAARLGSGYPFAGSGFELKAIVAVVLGGTALVGGRGGVIGTLGGVFLLAISANILNLLGISPFVQQVVDGAIIIVAVAIYTAGRRAA